MKLSNQALLNCVSVLRRLNQLELPVKVAFVLSKNAKVIEKELGHYSEAREKLVKKYAVLDENDMPLADEHGNLQFKEGCIEDWNSDINELLNIDVNVKLQTLSIHDLFKSDLRITPAELSLIDFMLKE